MADFPLERSDVSKLVQWQPSTILVQGPMAYWPTKHSVWPNCSVQPKWQNLSPEQRIVSFTTHCIFQKSVNLQYNKLGRWAKRLGNQAFDVPSLFFYIISCKVLSIFFYNFTKIKRKSFECPKSIRNYEKKNMYLEHQMLAH